MDSCVSKRMENAEKQEMKSLAPGKGVQTTARKLPQIDSSGNGAEGDHGMVELNHDGIKTILE